MEARVAMVEGKVEEQGKMWGALREDISRLDERIDRRFASIDQRFAGIDHRFDALEQKMDRRFDAMDAKMSRQFMWLAGILITTLAALTTAVIAAVLSR